MSVRTGNAKTAEVTNQQMINLRYIGEGKKTLALKTAIGNQKCRYRIISADSLNRGKKSLSGERRSLIEAIMNAPTLSTGL